MGVDVVKKRCKLDLDMGVLTVAVLCKNVCRIDAACKER